MTSQLVDYALGFDIQLPDPVSAAALHHIVDTVAVAIAGTTAEASQVAARLAATAHSTPGATVIGTGTSRAPDMAAFANSIMVRTYDWNDGMQAKGGGHPSDMIPGLLAAAEVAHSPGADLMAATTVAYEILGALGTAFERRHFDQGLFMGAATALGCARLLGLSRDQTGHAASLALTLALPLGVHRWGELSMTKGASTAFAVRHGVFAALLAQHGFTSAPNPVEGYYGLHHITGDLSLRLPVLPGGMATIEMSHQKLYPAESQVLGLLDLVPKIRAWASVDEIESIELQMSERTVRHIADPPKYDPQTRETADHSLPYILAVALVDGEINLASYLPDRFLDPDLRPVMNKIRATPADDLTQVRLQMEEGVTRAFPSRITIRKTTGEQMHEELRYHKGHFRDPMTRADLDLKFDKACAGVVTDDQRDQIRDAWWRLPEARDASTTIQLLANLDRP